MDSDDMIQERPYIAAMNGKWQDMIDYYQENSVYLFSRVTLSLDTGFHLAVHSNEEQPLKDLLGIMGGREFNLPGTRNKFGNTVLHEATIYGNYEAVRLLVDCCPDLISITNEYGETPLFTAAEFGEAEIVEFLIATKPEQCVDDKHRLLSIHRKRRDGLSILGAAILGHDFETALLLLELDVSLHSLKDKKGITALQLLAHMPSAFESGFPMGIFERLIYCCLPVRRKVKFQVETSGQAWKGTEGDVESGLGSSLERKPRGGLLNYFKVPKARLQVFWNQKRKHVFALRLAKILIDNSLKHVIKDQNEGEKDAKGKIEIEEQPPVTSSSLARKKQSSLFVATINGIEEIVWEIINKYPHAVEHLNEKGQSILDVAVKHRQKNIFSLVKHQKVPLARLHRVVDKKGNTLLHHVADTKHYRGGTKPGPALELQEELQWFEQVEKVIPSHYVTLRNKKGKTAEELFKENHKDQLKNAQKWIKETTQSCSTVAALVATVVFAAAYTVPGGSDKNGTPNFINSPYFLVFTVSDVLSLASSLTSLVVFLSFSTSPFQLQEFNISLPRKLLVGFTFLFFAVITTMLSFGATILILIQSEKKLTTLLLSMAAFLPVLVFAIMEFRLYVSFMGSTYNNLTITREARQSFLVPRQKSSIELINMGDLTDIEFRAIYVVLPFSMTALKPVRVIYSLSQENSEYLFSPVTLSLDTGFHLAVHSNEEQPLKDLLGIMEGRELFLPETRNKFGNTVLHEATIFGNYEAVRFLVERCPDLISITNKYGETPLFTAAGSETALLLLELDESLHSLKDKNGITALQLLAHMPSAFESGFPMGIFERLIYCCLPVICHHEVKLQLETRGQAGQGVRDLESGLGSCLERNRRGGLLNYLKKDTSWKSVSKTEEGQEVKQTGPPSSTVMQGDQNKGKEAEQGMGVGQTSEITSKAIEKEKVQHPTAQPSVTNSSLTSNEQIPLFLATRNEIEGIIKLYPHAIKQLNITNSPLTREEQIPLLNATRNGIEEIVWEIIKLYPHAVEKLNDKGQSILDVAVIHRQKGIFNLVKQRRIPLARLHRNIDKNGNTLLHHVAVMTEHSGGTKPGPAHHLQDELQWFEQVRKLIPSQYVTLRNNDGMTASELFYEQHKEQLNNARTWIKETTQSCSTVAALVATFVFAAAYTVPGGSDENGKPNLIISPYFLTFAVADVVSLAFSLTSLTVFLSLLTSRFELQDFHIALPRKLTVGFTFLFLSMMTSMLSFGSTILILVDKVNNITPFRCFISSCLGIYNNAIPSLCLISGLYLRHSQDKHSQDN
ncbi:hypothetical protein NC652_027247 [Populus alba x Populus x berolinensis]|nr:hypothetical protein NC652_027247 [Populus alba x Populus x berolinensis]